MNDGDSAGGGLNPASPAVTDRRSTQQIAITSISNTSIINSQSTTETKNIQYQEIFSQQLQQIPSGSAVSTITSQPIKQQSPTTRNILVVTTIQQPMTITQHTRESTPPIVSVVNRPSSYNSTDSSVPITTVLNNLTPTHSQVKRFKLDVGVTDITALKKRILEHKLARKRIIKEKYVNVIMLTIYIATYHIFRHSENVVELFFLSIGGNMMDYPTWKKKPLPQQFNDYNKAYKLNALSNSEDQKQVRAFYCFNQI